jgi:hypothetical protein
VGVDVRCGIVWGCGCGCGCELVKGKSMWKIAETLFARSPLSQSTFVIDILYLERTNARIHVVVFVGEYLYIHIEQQ